MEEPIRDPSIPYAGPIRGGRFSPGKVVRIEGIVPGTAYRFNINLQCGSQIVPRDDVAVQIAVRMLDGYIALNSLQNGIWGEEQVCVTLTIKRAEKFDISIKCHFNQYEVVINGQHFCDFPQRIHYDRITHLTIDGDVSVTLISYTSGEMETIGGGDVWVPQATVSAPTLQLQNNLENFEIINPNAAAPPPSYDTAMQKNQIGFGNQITPAGGLPYPTAAPYPTSSPYSPTGSPYAPTTTPYPTEPKAMPAPGGSPYATYGTPYPTSVPGLNSNNYYPPSGAPGIPPPPPGAPIPLNAASSHFRPVQRSNRRMYISIFGAIAVAIVISIMAVMVKRNRRSTSSSYNYDN